MKKIREILASLIDKLVENSDHIFHQYQSSSLENDVEDYGCLEITKSTSKAKPSKSDPSSFWNPTQLIKVDGFHQLMNRPCHIFTTAGLDGVYEDNILVITQSTSKNNISKSETSRLWNPTQVIKVSSCKQLTPQPWQIDTQATYKNNISKYETSQLQKPTEMIKLANKGSGGTSRDVVVVTGGGWPDGGGGAESGSSNGGMGQGRILMDGIKRGLSGRSKSKSTT